MAEFLSPGVFIEEVPSAVKVVQAVSTSNFGIIGFTERGPTDTATLVTSLEDFTAKFGNPVSESFVPLSMAAYYANGGKRAFVVRVVPSDAVSADAKIQSKTSDQQLETGDGATMAFTKTASTSPIKDNDGASPVVLSSFALRWRPAAAAVAAEASMERDGATVLVAPGAVDDFEGRIDPASLQAFDDALLVVATDGTAVLTWLSGAMTKTLTFAAPSSGTTATATNGATSTGTLDYQTGRFTMVTDGTETPDAASTFDWDYTPAGPTETAVDDGAGALVSTGLTAGTITYVDGAYAFTTTAMATPHDGSPVVATYKIDAWDLDPVSAGIWGNQLRVSVSGSGDFFNALTSSYTRHDLTVSLLNSQNIFEVLEIFEEMDFADPASTVFAPDVINELSDLITMVDPGGNEAPLELGGLSRGIVMAGGDGSAAGQVVTSEATNTALELPNAPIAARTVTISYTGAISGALSITADGTGAMTGAVDGTYVTSITLGGETILPNALSYATGRFNFKTSEAIAVGTLVTVTYHSVPEESSHNEDFGDAAKGYTAGTNGTFTSVTYGRDQLTSPTLITPKKGLYALNTIDELMQVGIPDFAGDVTVTGDMIDYAATRAAQPSGGDRFLILQVPKGSDAQEAVDWFRFQLGRFSIFAALYWPWVKVADPLSNGRPLTMPAIGHIAGIYARTDTTKNVGKAPGGTVDGQLNFLLGLEVLTTQGERDFVYPNKINPLISGANTGLAVWGVRTISNLSEWRYINVRRLFMFLEKSIYNSTFWIVFENNGPGLWSKIKAQITGFLQGLFNDGLFAGTSPAEAFFVIVDGTNNTAASVEAGQVIIDVGVAPNKPAEFVRFRFQQLVLS
jgi:phage tail sheath protein FI